MIKNTCASFARLVPALCILLLLALVSGCDRGASTVPDRLIHDPHASGNDQAGLYETTLRKPFRAIVEGPTVPGLLGGKGSRHAVPGVTVHFAVQNTASGAVFTESDAPTLDTVTDAGGMAAATLRLGHKAGDVVVVASLPDYPHIAPIRFRALAGAERIGSKLETTTGGTIGEFGIRLVDEDGTPARGVKVFFSADGNTQGASVKAGRVVTNEEGRAVTSWKLGKKVAQYYASVEIRDERADVAPEARFQARKVTFKAMATNRTQMVIVLLGGLAVFIFGMKLMSEGLQRMADRRLKSILNFMTQNRLMAVFAGVLMTAMVQSSSATTVMTVGFVNAGLMNLAQAIGVVFGANIGTTVTAQIIAFKLDALAYPSIAVGLLLMSVAKKPHLRAFGQAVLGFGLLFLGMTTMSGILKPLRHSPSFVAWFQMFDCTPTGGFLPPGRALMCILIGTATTVIVQSSSATVGLVLALSSQGLIGFYTAVPLILGDNIGTTITANLAALGANRNAKRTAVAHTLFNVFGAAYMYALLFVPLWKGQPFFLGFVDWITPGDVFSQNPENLLRHVANAHSAFNIFNVLLFLPFLPLMVRVCHRIVPVTDADRDTVLQYLEPNLLSTPSIALRQAVREVYFMIKKGEKSMNQSCDLLCNGDRGLEQQILKREDLIDRLQKEITAYLVELSQTGLGPEPSALIPALIHAVNDAERLGDHAESLVELRRLLREGDLSFSKEEIASLREYEKQLNGLFACVYRILDGEGTEAFNEAKRIDAELKRILRVSTDLHVERLDQGHCNIQAGVIYLDAFAHLERVGSHLLNIAERAIKIARVVED